MAPDGYVWWYVDALSEDGAHGITLIAFLGSVFSPYYRWARRNGPADPLRHCALNIALYGAPSAWSMTERAAVIRTPTDLTIGRSHVHWTGDTLVLHLNERCAPIPRPIRGVVRVRPNALTGYTAHIDNDQRHRWRPIAPSAHVNVELERPATSWSGTGYLDSNDGDEPLEAGFHRWDWSRATLAGGKTAILYHTVPRQGPERGLAIRIDPHGAVEDFEAPGRIALARSFWRIPRITRADSEARVTKTLVDAPFYARSTLATRLFGSPVEAMHESVDLDRFSSLATQLMLPFRMPRALRSSGSPSSRP